MLLGLPSQCGNVTMTKHAQQALHSLGMYTCVNQEQAPPCVLVTTAEWLLQLPKEQETWTTGQISPTALSSAPFEAELLPLYLMTIECK